MFKFFKAPEEEAVPASRRRAKGMKLYFIIFYYFSDVTVYMDCPNTLFFSI